MAVIINIMPLVATKYAGFVWDNISILLGTKAFHVPEIEMPIGISFYTFQVITYVIDLYGARIRRQNNPFLFALYIMFFPQLIAGPIVKYSEIESELEHPDVSWTNIKYGMGRLITGLGKKVLIANQVGYISDSVFNCPIESLTTGMTWLCVIAYTIQIYYDFSGYSEMAIGLGAIFGFHFPENFDTPYTSRSISEFWRRWHITLGRFFREYVYIPLGGNRVGVRRWIINLFIVWALTGLWHGASWNFIIWGLYYGILIILERITGLEKKIPAVIGWFFTFFLVSFGWGIFMCDNMSFKDVTTFLGKLIIGGGHRILNPCTVGSLRLWGYLPFLCIGIIMSTPVGVSIKKRVRGAELLSRNRGVIADIWLLFILVCSLIFLVGGTYNPFIYFRF